jgi:exopolyphosphatase/guanosine-5'-triphosphate,3'-diphosphate pyrophosphatase
MRLGVLDVGSNTVHLQVIDAHRGARPLHSSSFKADLRLTDYLDEFGKISSEGVNQLFQAIRESVSEAHRLKTDEILAFATSAIREASNGAEIIDSLNQAFELDLQVLSGEEEARFTFLAVRRWLGWSSGNLLVIDIGGGSLEIGAGEDESPEIAHSFPLGAGRMTRQFLTGDPFSEKSLTALERHFDETLVPVIEALAPFRGFRAVGTSKTLRTLARLTQEFLGDVDGEITPRALEVMTKRLMAMSSKEREQLPKLSRARANQVVAGAMLARHLVRQLELSAIEICPWALREGVVLRRLDWLENLN